MKPTDLLASARDALDILKHTRSLTEVAKGLAPKSMLTQRVLNDRDLPPDPPPGQELIRRLRALRNRLKAEHLDAGAVNYAALRDSAAYQELEEASVLLKSLKPSDFDGDDQKNAFWINLYNVLAIHGVIALKIKDSAMEIPSFFSVVSYQVGEHVFCLDDIQNGVLRRNSPHPVMGKPPWPEGDPRLAWSPTRLDPRLHLALVCVAKSCPIGFYDPEHLEHQLELASQNFVANAVKIEPDHISMPLVFRYSTEDFGGKKGLQTFLIKHAPTDGDHNLQAALQAAFDADLPFEFQRYDWSLNHT